MGLLTRRKESNKPLKLFLVQQKESGSVPIPSLPCPPEAQGQPVPRLTGKEVSQGLYAFVTGQLAKGEELLLSCPTQRAYEIEQRLVRAFDEGIPEEGLTSLLEEYGESHRMPGKAEPWTDSEVRLYYLTVKKQGRTIRGYTVNWAQMRIITELWRLKAKDAELDFVSL